MTSEPTAPQTQAPQNNSKTESKSLRAQFRKHLPVTRFIVKWGLIGTAALSGTIGLIAGASVLSAGAGVAGATALGVMLYGGIVGGSVTLGLGLKVGIIEAIIRFAVNEGRKSAEAEKSQPKLGASAPTPA